MLEVKNLVVAYGRVKAVKGISFTVPQGQVVSLLGTNGAGKTTTLRTISGLLRGEGEIWFAGERIDQVPAHLVVARGLAPAGSPAAGVVREAREASDHRPVWAAFAPLQDPAAP